MKKKQILAVLMICSIFVGSKGELVLAESPMDSLQVGETNLKLLLLAAGMQVKKISRLKKEKQNTSISIIIL